MSNEVLSNKEYVRCRRINISRGSEISADFFKDIEHILQKIRRKEVDIDGYDISINIRERSNNKRYSDVRALYDIFVDEPSKIVSELDLDSLIKYINNFIISDFYNYIDNFFAAFVSINHSGFTDEFEEEYSIDIDDIDRLPLSTLCDIANNELDWMGLAYEFVPLGYQDYKISCEQKS